MRMSAALAEAMLKREGRDFKVQLRVGGSRFPELGTPNVELRVTHDPYHSPIPLVARFAPLTDGLQPATFDS